jgi:CTP-dependent riboflavin kinase
MAPLDMPSLAEYLKGKLKEKDAEIAALKLELKHVRQKIPVDRDKLNELLIAGHSMTAAAKEAGCSKSAAHRAYLKLVDAGLIAKKAPMKAQVIDMREQGLTYKQICRQTDLSETYIKMICSQAGLLNDTLQNKR